MNADELQQLDRARLRLRRRSCRDGLCSGSVICSPMVRIGLSEVIGSWKIIEMSRPRISRISSSSRSSRLRPSKSDAALGDLAGEARQQPHDRERRDRFAGAGFADDGDDFAAVDREAHAFDRAHDAARGLEMDMQILDLQQRREVSAGRDAPSGVMRFHLVYSIHNGLLTPSVVPVP